PAFIININAVPPATGRIVGSSGSSKASASLSERGSAISNGIIPSSPSRRGCAQDVIGNFGACRQPDVWLRHRPFDDLLVEVVAAMVAANVGVAGHVDDTKFLARARDLDHFVVGLQHHARWV